MSIEFPLTDLLDCDRWVEWIIQHFYSTRFGCPTCGAPVEAARRFLQPNAGS